MNLRHLVYRFWYLFWFVILPLGLSWATVDVLDRLDAIEEFEIWYVLLIFAIVVIVLYPARDKLPFWQDRDESSTYNRRRRARAAAGMTRRIRRILKRKGRKVTERGRSEISTALESMDRAIASGDSGEIDACARRLEEKSNRHLAFAKKSAAREYAESIGVAVLVAVLLRLFVVEAFKIPSESMVPTLMVGDHIFVSKYRYGLSIPFRNDRIVRFVAPAYGDVVVFVKPSIEEQIGLRKAAPTFYDEYELVGKDFIKRIVGLPGDSVEMRDDVLFVNGIEVRRCRIGDQSYRTFNSLRGRWEDHAAELWVERHGDTLYTVIEELNGPRSDFGPAVVPDDQVFVLGDNRDNSNDSRYWGSVPFDNIKGRAMVIWQSNRRPHGFQWDRVGKLIMSDPDLEPDQAERLERCLGAESESAK